MLFYDNIIHYHIVLTNVLIMDVPVFCSVVEANNLPNNLKFTIVQKYNVKIKIN